MEIRKAKIGDLSLIQALAQQIWPTTYKTILSIDQIQFMLAEMYDLATLRKQMIEEGHTFLILESADTVLGFAAYSPLDKNNTRFKLHKIYLLPETHGKGLGKLLLNTVIAQVKQLGGQSLCLNVNRLNPALQFYKKMQFEIIEEVDIQIGSGYQMNDYVMWKQI
ncbi:MAG: N-acetyltransferase [Pedobacter sp.]|nr:MAG: N-acetyltransferase [Pedobacter sp.]